MPLSKKRVPSHINEIKSVYDTRCQSDMGGSMYEYAPGTDFSKYKTLKEFYSIHPHMRYYKKSQCGKQVVPKPAKDEIGSAYVNANTPWKCGKLNGIWDGDALSRLNIRSRGVCFVKKGDKECAAKDCDSLIRHVRKGDVRPPSALVSEFKARCLRDGGCTFRKTGECVSIRTMLARDALIKDDAVRKITRQGRAMVMRQRVKKGIFSQIKKKDNAATKIQRQAKVALARRRLDRTLADKRRAHHMNVSMKARAAERIQTMFRKHTQRKDALPKDWPSDLQQADVKDYLVKYYNKNKDQWPVETTKLLGVGNRCSGKNEQSKSMFSVPQAMMHALARGIAKNSNKDGTTRGLLAWHSTGSGKTCTASSIMDAYWKTNKEIIFVTSIEAKAANPPDNFLKCMRTYLKRNEITPREMASRVKFFTFASLAHYLQLHRPSGPASDAQKRAHLLSNAVLIIDEVQNLLKPLPQQVPEHTKLIRFLNKDNTSKTKRLNVYILTATPGDTSKDIVNLLNLVRDRRHSEIKEPDSNSNSNNLTDFNKKIQGIVQYYNTNKDLSRFPKVVHNPIHKCSMSGAQFKEYARAYNEDSKKGSPDVEEYPNPKFFALSRKYSNMLYNRGQNMPLAEFSGKLVYMFDVIKRHDMEKHWVYSAFYENRGYGQGIMGIKRALESEAGFKYEQLTPVMARDMLNGSVQMTNKKRFCVLTTTMLPKRSDLSYLVALYNHERNVRGEICQIMLASQKFNEGVDLKAVRHIHLLEPTLTETMRQQAIGRARRNCSHEQFHDRKDWTVHVHEYDSIYGNRNVNHNNPNVNFKKDIVDYTSILKNIQMDLKTIVGVRGVGNKRAKLKLEEKDVKAKLREFVRLSANVKATREQTATVQSVDEKVRGLAASYNGGVTERMLIMMKNASVDCKVMRRFHGDKDITC